MADRDNYSEKTEGRNEEAGDKYVTGKMYENSWSDTISLIKVWTPIIGQNMLIHLAQQLIVVEEQHVATAIIAISIMFEYSSHFYHNEYLEQMTRNIWQSLIITELFTNIYWH